MQIQVQRPFQCSAATTFWHPLQRNGTTLFPSWCHQSALDVVNVAEPVQIRPREPFSYRA